MSQFLLGACTAHDHFERCSSKPVTVVGIDGTGEVFGRRVQTRVLKLQASLELLQLLLGRFGRERENVRVRVASPRLRLAFTLFINAAISLRRSASEPGRLRTGYPLKWRLFRYRSVIACSVLFSFWLTT